MVKDSKAHLEALRGPGLYHILLLSPALSISLDKSQSTQQILLNESMNDYTTALATVNFG